MSEPRRRAEPAPELADWLSEALSDPGPFSLTPLAGGRSNETLLLESPAGRRVLRRPPGARNAPGAHSMEREERLLRALDESAVPAPRPLALAGEEVDGGPLLVMEWIAGLPLTDALPASYPSDAAGQVGAAAIDALASLHAVDWRAAGLEGFGRPEAFLERQVDRWRTQYRGYQVRELADFEALAEWLDENRPSPTEPAILHGDFHLDNCLFSPAPPIRVEAVIDWETATIGDPLLDLGLLLGFWGTERPRHPAMPKVQGVSRGPGSPSRRQLAERYARRSGRSIERIEWYICAALWKLAAIVEGAYARQVRGELDSAWARSLEADVPALLAEAAELAEVR